MGKKDMSVPDMRGQIPESWNCIDCGINTAPGAFTRKEFEDEWARKLFQDGACDGVTLSFDEHSEVYTVKANVWKAARMEDFGGCLCVGCLEKRLGRNLTPKDFMSDHPFNRHDFPATERLRNHRGG